MAHPLSRPGLLLRVEGAFALAVAAYLFHRTDGNWPLFVLLLFAPDLGLLGYVGGSRLGSLTYNLAHTYASPAVLGLAGTALNSALLVSLALIWAAHIGMDRLFGYGLKYAYQRSMDTHLGRV